MARKPPAKPTTRAKQVNVMLKRKKDEPVAEPQTDPTAFQGMDTMSIAQLRALIRGAESRIEERLDAERRALIEDTKRRASDLGLDVADLFGASSASAPRRGGAGATREKPPAKYRGPNGEEWSGRGKAPRWVQALEAGGGSRTQYLIRGTQAPPPASSS